MIKRAIRLQLPETNSSSTHSVVIQRLQGSTETCNIPLTSDGKIAIVDSTRWDDPEVRAHFIEQGEYFGDAKSKAQYIYCATQLINSDQMYLAKSNSELLKVVEDVIKEFTGASEVQWKGTDQVDCTYDCGSVYQDIFIPYADDEVRLKEELRKFLFSPDSGFFVGNDNSGYEDLYVPTRLRTKESIKQRISIHFPEPLGRVDIDTYLGNFNWCTSLSSVKSGISGVEKNICLLPSGECIVKVGNKDHRHGKGKVLYPFYDNIYYNNYITIAKDPDTGELWVPFFNRQLSVRKFRDIAREIFPEKSNDFFRINDLGCDELFKLIQEKKYDLGVTMVPVSTGLVKTETEFVLSPDRNDLGKRGSSDYITTSYLNGNYSTTVYSSGTKIFRALRDGEDFKASFPDSLDIKLTNKCPWGCKFCHESSTASGKHADLGALVKTLREANLPAGVEIALGGGDVLDIPEEEFAKFLVKISGMGLLPRITLNYRDILNDTYYLKLLRLDKRLESLITDGGARFTDFAIGISIDKYDSPEISVVLNRILRREGEACTKIITMEKVVFHIIPGVLGLPEFKKLYKDVWDNYSTKRGHSAGFLFLGYKKWGRATDSKVPDLSDWSKYLSENFYSRRTIYSASQVGPNSFPIIGFDNLAIEQLGIRDKLLPSEWESIYMGDEFTHSMYIDAVSQTYAETSRSPKRVSWSESGLLDFFKSKQL